MPSLERRVESLEERSGVRPFPKPLMFIRAVPTRDGRALPLGELIGYRWDGELIRRRRGETETDFKERAEAFVLETTTNQFGEIIFEERGPSPAEHGETA